MVVYNWMMVPKSFTMEKWLEITPIVHPLRNLLFFGCFLCNAKNQILPIFVDELAG